MLSVCGIGADQLQAAVVLVVYLELRAIAARHGIAPRRKGDPPQ